MDGRDGIGMQGSYYWQRGLSSSANAGTHPGLHGAVPPGMRPMPNPGSGPGGSLALQPTGIGIGPSAFQVESSQPISAHGGGVGGSGGGVIQQGEQVKRKRGRPRKYGPDGGVALALSPISSSGPSLAPAMLTGSSSGLASGSGSQKRGRGRPPGTGRKQQLASLGEWVAGSAGMGFTPHVITVDIGEDIATKIMSFSQQGPRAVCILSANGAVSTVTLRQPSTSGGTVTYEGRFEILCLSGSYMVADNDGPRSRSGGLSISLSSPDGRVIGGGVGGLLRAATPVQVIVGSFLYAGSKAKNKGRASHDSGAESELQAGDNQSMPPTSLPNPSLSSPTVMAGWPSRQLDMRSSHIDIDLTRN